MARPTGVRRLVGSLVLLVLATAGCAAEAPEGAGPPSAGPTPAAAWRTEVWRDLAVDVPADWAWGSGAADVGVEGAALCGGPGPSSRRPYVGRPIPTSDVCTVADHPEAPRAPYVWLGAPLDPGVQELGHGWVQETVELQGTTLTVTSDDPALRQHVLRSARHQVQCGATKDDPGPPGSLCVYGPVGGDVATVLLYGTTISPTDAAAFVRAVGAARDVDASCASVEEYVVLTVSSGDRYVVEPGCGVVVGPDGGTVELTRATRPAWARDGIPLVLRSEIGLLG